MAGRSRGSRLCYVVGCSNNSKKNSSLGFIMAPTPDDPERRTAWLTLMHREDLIGNDEHIRIYVCECHFAPSEIKIVNQRKNLINMDVVPRFHLPFVSHDGATSTNNESETSESQKRCTEVTIQTQTKKQRLEAMLHTEVEIKEERMDEDGEGEGKAYEVKKDEEVTDKNRTIAEDSQSSLNTSIVIDDNLSDYREELKYATKVGLTKEKEPNQDSEFSDGYKTKKTYQDLLESLSFSVIPDKDIDNVDENDASNFIFTGEREMLGPHPKLPSGFFELFLMSDKFHLILKLMNKGIARNNRPAHPLKMKEFRVFLGLLLYMGSFNFEHVSDYFKIDGLFQTYFGRFMKQPRFLTILNCLRFTGKQDSFASVRPVVDHFNEVMSKTYVPGMELLVEENMWHLKQRTSVFCPELEQSDEPTENIRLYLLREPCGTVVKVHLEKCTDINHTPFEEVFFFSLAQDKLDVGRLLYFQSHQTSCELAAKLLARKTYCIGSLSKMPPNVPDAIVNVPLSANEIKSISFNGMHVGKWKISEDKELMYVTTEPPARTFRVVNIDEKPVKMCGVAEMYCQTHFKVTSLIARYYPSPVRQQSWQMKIFVYIMMLSLVNAHRLYNKFSGYMMDFSKFRMVVITKLLLLPLEQESDPECEVSGQPHRLDLVVQRDEAKAGLNVAKGCAKCLEIEDKYCLTYYQCRACPGAPFLCPKCFCDTHSS